MNHYNDEVGKLLEEIDRYMAIISCIYPPPPTYIHIHIHTHIHIYIHTYIHTYWKRQSTFTAKTLSIILLETVITP